MSVYMCFLMHPSALLALILYLSIQRSLLVVEAPNNHYFPFFLSFFLHTHTLSLSFIFPFRRRVELSVAPDITVVAVTNVLVLSSFFPSSSFFSKKNDYSSHYQNYDYRKANGIATTTKPVVVVVVVNRIYMLGEKKRT